ncbi:putative reverse transcriptase, RNA-dependent DNA polymerase [Tanacetum coccineum]|uniref:Reverse transcriptase, RNA-dependent DNA polymerase n=1 Tax=Tanacetum coccineum TaxID=301880 RepID=A0ABQ5GE77_9ASTR
MKSGCFRVKDVRRLLDDMLLPKSDVPSRWVKQIPIKVNVLAWKISMDRLPTRVNLHRRGVQVSPISCPICCEALENLDHLLFCCDLAKDIARSICNWWGLVWNPVDSYRSWLSWFNLVQLQSSSKQVLEGVFYTSWWSIWSYRNHLLFSNSNLRKDGTDKSKIIRKQSKTNEHGHENQKSTKPKPERIEAIRLFLAYASFKDFIVYHMDVKSAFLYGKIEEEVYVCQPLGFEDLEVPDRVYKVEKALYGLHQAPRACNKPMENFKPLMKDEHAEDVDVQLYRSMIGSLMYLTSSRPNIMFDVCACARFQVIPKVSHLHAVKRIFRYLKGQPKLGLWYPKDSPFDLEAYTDSDYAGASLDRKSTTGVLWIQNQMLDYGYNFMNTKIFIDNESTICIVKNLVFHSKTKHIEIRHHFIRDSNEKKLIQMIKIHTDQNVADLLTKAFDVSRFQYLIASIGMLNL